MIADMRWVNFFHNLICMSVALRRLIQILFRAMNETLLTTDLQDKGKNQ